MKSTINRLLIALLLVTLASAAAFGKGKKRASVSFSMDTTVNGTLIKSGTYDVVFDEESGELSILKGSKVIATTATRLEQLEHKARATETDTSVAGDETKLISITFGGSDQRVVVNQGGMQMGASK